MVLMVLLGLTPGACQETRQNALNFPTAQLWATWPPGGRLSTLNGGFSPAGHARYLRPSRTPHRRYPRRDLRVLPVLTHRGGSQDKPRRASGSAALVAPQH